MAGDANSTNLTMEPVVGYSAWCTLDDLTEKAEHTASLLYYPDEPQEPLIDFLQEHGLESVDAVVSVILAEGRLGYHVRVKYSTSSKAFTYYSMR